MAVALRSVPMLPKPEDHARRQRRQSWWLLVSRLASGTTQQAAADAIGLSNASSYGDYERGVTPLWILVIAALVVFDLARERRKRR